MEKEKKSIPKIILHVLEYILLAFIIFLIIFVVLKACEKDVKALSSTDPFLTDDVNINDLTSLQNANIYYFDISDTRPLSNGYYQLVSIYSNNQFLEYISVQYYGLNAIDISSSMFTTIGYNYADSNNNYVIALVIYRDNNVLQCFIDLIEITPDNQYSIVLGSPTNQFGNNITNLSVDIRASFWINGIFTNVDLTSGDMLSTYRTTLATNYIYITEEYKQDHLFGDVVSSFLNIQFGQFTIGNTTYSLTLGMLLLFIIGLGALFIIIKVFLGG